MIEYTGKYTTAKIMTDFVDDATGRQINKMLRSPAMTNQIVIMPDTHMGKGSVIGFTMGLTDKVIPNVIGVDINCGLLSAKIKGELSDDSPEDVDKIVRSVIPVGFSRRETPALQRLESNIEDLAKLVGVDRDTLYNSIGTLGGGNHFIEFGLDDDGGEWVTIHTGSRYFGLRVATYYQEKAVRLSQDFRDKIAELKKSFSGKKLGEKISQLKKSSSIESEMEYLEGKDLDEYIEAMSLAAIYANINRITILNNIGKALGVEFEKTIHCEHNIIGRDDLIIRKGAVPAYEGQKIILPFNRTEGIWILEGKGNPEWNYSAPHGAGRVMSRAKAKELILPVDAKEEIKAAGVYSSHDPVDESNQAYKDPKLIQSLIEPTAKYLFSIKPYLNIKG